MSLSGPMGVITDRGLEFDIAPLVCLCEWDTDISFRWTEVRKVNRPVGINHLPLAVCVCNFRRFSTILA